MWGTPSLEGHHVALVLWWVGGIWLGVGLCLVLLYVGYELFGTPARAWRERLRDLAVHLPIVLPIAVLGWPFLFVFAYFQVRRDLTLEQACFSGALHDGAPVTEMQWQRGRDAVRLLTGLCVPLSERKRRLLACAFCRRIWDRLDDERSREAVEVAERLADGLAGADEVRSSSGKAATAAGVLTSQGELEAAAAAKACQDCLSADAASAALRASVSRYRRRRRERREQCELLREIVGNPFRPLRPRRFDAELVELARAIHEGEQGLYPLLADALDDLGEYEAAEHCRRAGHWRGCHVIDWVLGWR
jgi:hypothetical protein